MYSGLPPIRTLDDIRELGEHVRARGFTALKTNIFLLDGGSPELYMPGFGRVARWARAQSLAPRRGGARQTACGLP